MVSDDPFTQVGEFLPFRSIVVRAVEVVHAVEEALRIIDGYERPRRPAVEVPPGRGVGAGATEAPRGLLHHRYALAEDGTLTGARIVPPTARNQAAVEEAGLADFRGWRVDHEDLAHRFAHLLDAAPAPWSGPDAPSRSASPPPPPWTTGRTSPRDEPGQERPARTVPLRHCPRASLLLNLAPSP